MKMMDDGDLEEMRMAIRVSRRSLLRTPGDNQQFLYSGSASIHIGYLQRAIGSRNKIKVSQSANV